MTRLAGGRRRGRSSPPPAAPGLAALGCVIGLAALAARCGDDGVVGPEPTVDLWTAGCATSADCREGGVCIDILGALLCAAPCAGTGTAATCPSAVAGGCQPDGAGQQGCRPTCDDGAACPGDLVCVDRGASTLCAAADAPHTDTCESGYTYCDGECVVLVEDPRHCGGCGEACAPSATCIQGTCECPGGETDCEGVCTKLQTDPLHCGGCGHACSIDHANTTCISGKCAKTNCQPGWLDCDETAENGCETAVETVPAAAISIDEGTKVDPQTLLHLSAEGSTVPTGQIAAWEWTVTLPIGLDAAFEPDAASAEVALRADAVGTYAFGLRVQDEQGAWSCVPESKVVTVVPKALAHIELLWDSGANLDLHLAHEELAVGGPNDPDPWFHETYDCWAGNPNPGWGNVLDPKDDPNLERPDDDGVGPEILSLQLPEHEKSFRLAVHHAGGATPDAAQVTIRVYVYDKLTYQRSEVAMSEGDLWTVGTLDWAQLAFLPVQLEGSAPDITPSYPAP